MGVIQNFSVPDFCKSGRVQPGTIFPKAAQLYLNSFRLILTSNAGKNFMIALEFVQAIWFAALSVCLIALGAGSIKFFWMIRTGKKDGLILVIVVGIIALAGFLRSLAAILHPTQ